ncbi:Urmylation protein [Ceratobasidium sp. 370]|nr:Urmylation protein [Ceratobasidium sp. 370]
MALDKPAFSNMLADIKPLEDDYVEFCGDLGGTPDPVNTGMFPGEPGSRVNALDLRNALVSTSGTSATPLTIIDTRSPTEFGICSIPESTNIPLAQILKRPDHYLPSRPSKIFVVCRLGNDSRIAAHALRRTVLEQQDLSQADGHRSHQVVDVIGGLRAWARDVDPSFPVY